MTQVLISYSLQTWTLALTGAASVGLIGLLPLFLVPDEEKQKDKPYLEFLLSIAVGSQLADVFLHLLPEAFAHPHASSIHIGLWTLVGLFVFFLIEQVFPEDQRDDDQTFTEDRSDAVKTLSTRPSLIVELHKNNAAIVRRQNPIKTTGYLNLLANFIDNLTHGAAIGGSFAVSSLVGMTTLAGIVIHEIPHEMGDFAILLRSGFDRRQASKAQLITGLGGVLGASMALYYSSSIHSIRRLRLSLLTPVFSAVEGTLWVLPFTSGGFLYVALVKTVPDLLKENDLKHSLRQFVGVLIGLSIIYLLVLHLG